MIPVDLTTLSEDEFQSNFNILLTRYESASPQMRLQLNWIMEAYIAEKKRREAEELQSYKEKMKKKRNARAHIKSKL